MFEVPNHPCMHCTAVGWCCRYFNMLPRDLMIAAFGVGLCFFGGVYPAAIAAAEAFRVCVDHT